MIEERQVNLVYNPVRVTFLFSTIRKVVVKFSFLYKEKQELRGNKS